MNNINSSHQTWAISHNFLWFYVGCKKKSEFCTWILRSLPIWAHLMYFSNMFSLLWPCQFSPCSLSRRSLKLELKNKNGYASGPLGGSVGWVSDFSSGHDLTVRELEPCIGLCADGSEPGARCGSFVPSLSALPRSHTLSNLNTHLLLKMHNSNIHCLQR